MQTQQKGISGYWLKMIAVLSMLIDHTSAVILESIPGMEVIAFSMRLIGRLAFPIYCFLLVEGFFYTRSRKKYALRLFGFALLSEIPFDLAFNSKVWDASYNNVFFTLLLGLLVIWGVDTVRKNVGPETWGTAAAVLRPLFIAGIVLAGGAAAILLRTDYSAVGVLAIFLMYMAHPSNVRSMCSGVLILGALGGLIELVALVDVVLISFYNGTRGKQIKYFFYLFYPVHLLLLCLIAWAMGVKQL